MAAQTNASICDGKVVSIHYKLHDEAGELLDSSRDGEPLSYLHGAGNIVPGLEQSLLGRNLGDQLSVSVPPESGYGARDPRGVQRVPRGAFPGDMDLSPGMTFTAEDSSGGTTMVWIQSVQGDEVVIDQNHPLAGRTLLFDVTIAAIRDATREEIAHGHPHGLHGHHHH